jgi:hypothetical protein
LIVEPDTFRHIENLLIERNETWAAQIGESRTMTAVRIEFGISLKDQTVAREWADVEGIFNPNIDYRALAKRVVRNLPLDGPTRVTIKAGDRIIAVWSQFSEYCEQLGI